MAVWDRGRCGRTRGRRRPAACPRAGRRAAGAAGRRCARPNEAAPRSREIGGDMGDQGRCARPNEAAPRSMEIGGDQGRCARPNEAAPRSMEIDGDMGDQGRCARHNEAAPRSMEIDGDMGDQGRCARHNEAAPGASRRSGDQAVIGRPSRRPSESLPGNRKVLRRQLEGIWKHIRRHCDGHRKAFKSEGDAKAIESEDNPKAEDDHLFRSTQEARRAHSNATRRLSGGYHLHREHLDVHGAIMRLS